MFTFQGCHGLPSCLWCHQWPKSSRYKVLGFEALQPFMSDWTEGWISRYMRTHASTNKNLLSRDWLDQLTTHAYTAAPDIVLCGNKVLLTRHHYYEWNECFVKKSSFSTRWTWRDYEQCLRIEDDPWRLSWVFPTLRRQQQQAKVDSSLNFINGHWFYDLYHDKKTSVILAIQVSKRLWRRCWTLSCPGLRKVLPPSGVLLLISVAGRKAWISFQRGANIQQQPTSPSLAEAI